MDINRFCSPTQDHTYGFGPGRDAGFVYATDGRIAARVAAYSVAGPDSLESESRVSLIGLFDRFDPDRFDWHPIPPLDPAGARKCVVCEGSGRVTPCPECDGEGEFQHGSHRYECKHCDGDGEIAVHDPEESARPCRACAGSGLDSMTGVEVGAGFYAFRYLRLISEECPDAEIGVPYNNPEGMAMWRAPGVLGALMPIHR